MPIIQISNLSKAYRLGVINHGMLYKDIQSWWARLRGKEDPNSVIGMHNQEQMDGEDRFWALKDIDFEVNQGDRIGIIGKNGAGKSTLLKILSRVTAPTKGSVKVKGRIASLLEVGTGFHPELTGRENVFLNGAILGMSKQEIRKKFDEIVDFAGIEKFIDTPVKRYSSGMYVRLAFAVAAHLEPEILVVDEVLAVGDAAFQKKAIGKMEDVSNKEGRTVLFVSHNMGVIKNLCSRSVLLQNGEKIFYDKTELTVSKYNQLLRNIRIDEFTDLNNDSYRRGSGHIRITNVLILDNKDHEKTFFQMNDFIRIVISFKAIQNITGAAVYIALRSSNNNEIITSVRHVFNTEKITSGQAGSVCLELNIENIRPGEYPLYLHISEASPLSKRYEVLDDATPPITILNRGKSKFNNFDPSQQYGYFSIPSKIIYSNVKSVK